MKRALHKPPKGQELSKCRLPEEELPKSKVFGDCPCFQPEWKVGDGAFVDLPHGSGERGLQAGGMQRSWENLWQEVMSSQLWGCGMAQSQSGRLSVHRFWFPLNRRVSCQDCFSPWSLWEGFLMGLCFTSSKLSSSQCHLFEGNWKRNHWAPEHTVQKRGVD